VQKGLLRKRKFVIINLMRFIVVKHKNVREKDTRMIKKRGGI